MKRFFAILTSILLLCSAIPLTALSVAATSGTTGDCTWTLDDNGVLTISGQGKMESYNTFGTPWGKEITSVIVEEGVSFVGKYAFYDCLNLTSVSLPSTLSELGEGAFYGCTGLTEITLPDGLQSSGYFAFANCANLTTVTFGQGLLRVEDSSFRDCSSLTTVILPDTVYYIESNAFSGCGKLTEFHVPAGLTNIGSFAFNNCSSLKQFSIPDGVTAIPTAAFAGCRSLASVTLPQQLSTIDTQAFYNCSALTSIAFPPTLTTINGAAFQNCSSLTEVVIPGSVTVLSGEVFSGCSSVQRVVFEPYSGTDEDPGLYLDQGIFSSCYALQEVVWDRPITSIPNRLFNECSSLSSIVIPEGVTSIGENAFAYCNSLNTIHIPSSLTIIKRDAFLFANSLNDVSITDLSAWCSIRFENSSSQPMSGGSLYLNGEKVTCMEIPEDITAIPAYCFSDCNGLQKVIMHDGITSVGAYAFAWNQQLEEVVLSRQLSVIESHTFYLCNKLAKADLPEGLLEIHDCAFTDCAFPFVIIPHGVTAIEEEAFSSCDNVRYLVLPNTVTSIGYDMFGYINHFNDVYYRGTETDRDAISINTLSNERLLEATWHYSTCAMNEHLYSSDCDAYCNACDWVRESGDHTYDHACDPDCNLCGTVREVEPHAYVDTVTTPATCVTDGVTSYVCSVCGDTYTTVIPATGDHAYDHACDPDCNLCGTVREVEPHAYVDTVTTPATCVTDGVTSYVCSVCGDTYTTVIPATGDHAYDSDQDPSCNVCGTLRQITCPDTGIVIGGATFPAGTTVSVKRVEPIDLIPLFGELIVVYDISLSLDSVSIQPSGMVSVTLPMPESAAQYTDLHIVYIDENGHMTLCETTVNPDGTLTFFTDHFSHYGIVGTPQPSIVFGDVTGDGKINNKDLAMLQQHLSDWDVPIDEQAADVTGDNKINNKDLAKLQQYLSDWDVILG
ncbi:MAG: leucine-rich repeat protein [Clostridia bacterium]|nr:leucine-rich repeat protein [Clostridia bacterium]